MPFTYIGVKDLPQDFLMIDFEIQIFRLYETQSSSQMSTYGKMHRNIFRDRCRR